MVCRLFLAIAIVAMLSHSGSVHGQVFAASGFNDVTGINGDGISNNSPFNINSSPLIGQGGAEPGWFTPWSNGLGVGNVVTTNHFEGDGALLMQGTNIANRVLSQTLSGSRDVSTAMEILNSATSGGGVNGYIRQQSTGAIGPNWQASGDGHFRVVNGVEDGTAPLVDTGILWTPGSFQVIRVRVDTVTRKWTFSVDGVTFPMQLGYRDAPVFLDQIDFLNGVGAPNGTMLDSITVQGIPEPTTLCLVGIAAGGFWTRRFQKRLTSLLHHSCF